MACSHTVVAPARKNAAIAYLPLVLLPASTLALLAHAPPWVMMWLLAMAVFFGLKWLTLADYLARRRAGVAKVLGYFFLWPGMDPWAFFDNRRRTARPAAWQWLAALASTGAGLLLIFAASPRLLQTAPLWGACLGMAGIVLVLHFGLFHLLSLAWRTAGVDARAIMNAPILSRSLSEFWSRRWNLAFRDLSHRYLLRPLARRTSTAAATLIVFVVSGLVHDLVITIPARGGYGLPTLYFTLHGIAVLLERSRWGKRIGLGEGIAGRLFVVLVVVAPLPLAFPPPFVERVIVPMLHFIAA